jgi:hypothetical protein
MPGFQYHPAERLALGWLLKIRRGVKLCVRACVFCEKDLEYKSIH